MEPPTPNPQFFTPSDPIFLSRLEIQGNLNSTHLRFRQLYNQCIRRCRCLGCSTPFGGKCRREYEGKNREAQYKDKWGVLHAWGEGKGMVLKKDSKEGVVPGGLDSDERRERRDLKRRRIDDGAMDGDAGGETEQQEGQEGIGGDAVKPKPSKRAKPATNKHDKAKSVLPIPTSLPQQAPSLPSPPPPSPKHSARSLRTRTRAAPAPANPPKPTVKPTSHPKSKPIPAPAPPSPPKRKQQSPSQTRRASYSHLTGKTNYKTTAPPDDWEFYRPPKRPRPPPKNKQKHVKGAGKGNNIKPRPKSLATSTGDLDLDGLIRLCYRAAARHGKGAETPVVLPERRRWLARNLTVGGG